MRSKAFAILLSLVSLFAVNLFGETIGGLAVHVEKFDNNALRLWVGDHISSTAIMAFSTEKGIVVVDTTRCPILDKHFKQIIAREFGRDDFKYLINTHSHGDHTNGNFLYTDCEIIAHEKTGEGIKGNFGDQQRLIEFYTGRIPEIEKEIEESPEEGKARLKEDLAIAKMNLEAYKAGLKMALPTKTFKDTMTLDMGDMTFEMFYAGGIHSPDDIFILIPQKGLLLTGDVMADQWFTGTPGCLASFAMRNGVERNMPVLMKNWQALLDRKGEINDLIPGHWNGDISIEGFENRFNYVQDLYHGINKGIKEGKSLDKLMAEYALATKYPNMVDSPGINNGNHNASIIGLYCDVNAAESAARVMEQIIEKDGLEKAMKKVVAAREKGDAKLYFLEGDFNSLGYRLMNAGKMEEALAVFELNTKWYPDAWNVWDSLGECCMKIGKTDKAIECYTKSIELNPDNTNGKEILSQIKLAKNE